MSTSSKAIEIAVNDGYLIPDWPAPSWVKSAVSTRKVENENKIINHDIESRYNFFNIAFHVNDDKGRVAENRKQLIIDLALKESPQWIDQVHGVKSIELSNNVENVRNSDDKSIHNHGKRSLNQVATADASYTNQINCPCIIMTADCLPILLTNRKGTWVSAIHAGWRGLCDGIIESSVAKYHGKESDLIAWLGPAISQKHFEVGAEVRDDFLAIDESYDGAFKLHKPNYYMADLYFIARQKLSRLNIDTYGGDLCTYDAPNRFYSYRRDGETGRMASLIWIEERNE